MVGQRGKRPVSYTHLNGPNLNLLGQREREIYGSATYHDLLALIQETAQRLGLKADVRQSNHCLLYTSRCV